MHVHVHAHTHSTQHSLTTSVSLVIYLGGAKEEFE